MISLGIGHPGDQPRAALELCPDEVGKLVEELRECANLPDDCAYRLLNYSAHCLPEDSPGHLHHVMVEGAFGFPKPFFKPEDCDRWNEWFYALSAGEVAALCVAAGVMTEDEVADIRPGVDPEIRERALSY